MPARAWLIARPMPLPPPVTRAVLPSRSPTYAVVGPAKSTNSSSAFHVSTPGMCLAARLARARRDGQPLGFLHRGHLTRQDELHVRVAVGDPQPAAGRRSGANALDLRLVEADDRDHAHVLTGGLGHHAASLLDEQERRLPRDRSRGGKRRDLAEAVPGGDADVLESVGLAPYLVGGPAHGHHARLDDIGAVQLSDRAFEAQLAHRHLEQLFGALEDAP